VRVLPLQGMPLEGLVKSLGDGRWSDTKTPRDRRTMFIALIF